MSYLCIHSWLPSILYTRDIPLVCSVWSWRFDLFSWDLVLFYLCWVRASQHINVGETRYHWNVVWKIFCSGQKSTCHLPLFLLLPYHPHPNHQSSLLAVLLKYIHHLPTFLHLFCCHPGPSLHNLTVETVRHSFLAGDQKTVLYERDGVEICHLAQNFGRGKFWTISKL